MAYMPTSWRRDRWKRRCGRASPATRRRGRMRPYRSGAMATLRISRRPHCSCVPPRRTGSRVHRWTSAAACGWTSALRSRTMSIQPVIGFVGLGVMGGAMCRNIALKHPGDVIAFDVSSAAFAALDGTKARRAKSLREVAEQADIVFLSLPGGLQVEQVCIGAEGLASVLKRPSIIVDLSTTTVAVARTLAELLASVGVAFADAPVARTREAAQRGELSIMVGADAALYAKIEPLLRYMGSD